MRVLFFCILLLLFACTNPVVISTKNPLKDLEEELSGVLLGKQIPYLTKNIDNPENDIEIFMNHHKLIASEIDIYFKKNHQERFLQIQHYYNSRFQSNERDSLYGSWQTDSTEFILYKNSDSSILVNIFKRN